MLMPNKLRDRVLRLYQGAAAWIRTLINELSQARAHEQIATIYYTLGVAGALLAAVTACFFAFQYITYASLSEREKTSLHDFNLTMLNPENGAGLHEFQRLSPSRWIDRRPDKTIWNYKIKNRMIVNDCVGSNAESILQPNIFIFIPDRECDDMFVMWREGSGTWDKLGTMQDVR
jgi:hypothetical protein